MTVYYSTQMTALNGNAGGAVQNLPTVLQVGGKQRSQIANFAYASQASGSQIHVARLPVGAVIIGITVLTDTTLSTATLAFGDTGSGNSAIYAAATTFTSTDNPTRVGKTATHGAPITTAYDISGVASTDHEDVIATVGTASLPGSGNLTVIIDYLSD